MSRYELTFHMPNAGTSFFIRAETDDEARERAARIAARFEAPAGCAASFTRNGTPIRCPGLPQRAVLNHEH